MPAKKPTVSTLATAADDYYKLREERLALQRQVDALEVKEKALRKYLIESIPLAGAAGIAGAHVRVEVVEKPVAQIASPEEWPNFFAWVARNKAWELLTKKISAAAARERIDAGKKIPGVSVVQVKELSVHKIK